MIAMVKRYMPMNKIGGEQGEQTMLLFPEGEYVKHTDYLALAKLVMEWDSLINTKIDATSGEIFSHRKKVRAARTAMIAAAKEATNA